MSVLPYDETRKAIYDTIADSRQGVRGWLRRHNARITWEGELANTGDLNYHERIRLTIELPDPEGDGWLVAEGYASETTRGTKQPWQHAFDEALSGILDTLATRLVERSKTGAGLDLLDEVGLGLHRPTQDQGYVVRHGVGLTPR